MIKFVVQFPTGYPDSSPKSHFMRIVVLFAALLTGVMCSAQPLLILKKQRPPLLDVSTYRQVAVGDIVGPSGIKNEQSLDFTDALTSRLFNTKTLEVIDRATLDNIFGSQKRKDLQVLDEQAKQILNKKLGNAIFISGRLQSPRLEQKLIYTDQSVVINGCNRTYYYEVKGDVTVQLKILDLKTGRMIYSDAVTVPVSKQTKEDCNVPQKLDIDAITRNAIKDLSDEVAKLVVPYDFTLTLQFSDPGTFKSTFKQLKDAVSLLQLNNNDAGLTILKGYTESKDIKDKLKPNAWFNYGLGLLYTGKNVEAKSAFNQCAVLNTEYAKYVAEFIRLIDDEETVAKKMEKMKAERDKMQQEEIAETDKETEKAPLPKPAAKAKTKSKN